MTDPTHALSFGAAAGEYDRFRPRWRRPAPAAARDRGRRGQTLRS
ncbi:hypothetical protein AB0L34_30445 [Micromonospora sp. NPDC052213]